MVEYEKIYKSDKSDEIFESLYNCKKFKQNSRVHLNLFVLRAHRTMTYITRVHQYLNTCEPVKGTGYL